MGVKQGVQFVPCQFGADSAARLVVASKVDRQTCHAALFICLTDWDAGYRHPIHGERPLAQLLPRQPSCEVGVATL